MLFINRKALIENIRDILEEREKQERSISDNRKVILREYQRCVNEGRPRFSMCTFEVDRIIDANERLIELKKKTPDIHTNLPKTFCTVAGRFSLGGE